MSLSPREGTGSEADQRGAQWSLSPSGEQERRLQRVCWPGLRFSVKVLRKEARSLGRWVGG